MSTEKMKPPTDKRQNQRLRTRRALLAALREILEKGGAPSMEEVADRALVSRATAYRYYPNIETMILEAGFDAAMPATDDFFAQLSGADVRERLHRVPELLFGIVENDEAKFRRFLAATLLDSANALSTGSERVYRRGGRRFGLLEKALETTELEKEQRRKLIRMLALVVGPELFISGVDSCHMERKEIVPAMQWIVDAIWEKIERE